LKPHSIETLSYRIQKLVPAQLLVLLNTPSGLASVRANLAARL
jgi:hypothetical protein